MKWIKPTAAILFFLVAGLCLDPSSVIPFKGVQDFLKWLAKILQNHWNVTVILLGILFLIYIAKDILAYFEKAEEDENLANKTARENYNSISTVNSELTALNSQIAQTHSRLIVSKLQFSKRSLAHIYNIKSTLSSINQVYDNNLKTYHATNRKLYHIVSTTTLYSKNEIQPLIEQYQNLHE